MVGRLLDGPAQLLALRLTEARTWECLIAWVRTSAPLNGHHAMHSQEIGWVPRDRVRKLRAYTDDDYKQVPRFKS